MTKLSLAQPSPRAPLVTDGAKALYFALRAGPNTAGGAARRFLDRALAATRQAPCELPPDPAALDQWCTRQQAEVGQQYRAYLDERKRGGARHYFTGTAAALHFLRGAAPTKLVDGAWLYSVLEQWGDSAYHGLIRTYLEELGDGVDDKNHVLLYQNLLARHGCDQWEDLPEDHFVQGAIQLALAACGKDMLPELAGFNLGYEQLPLHLLITSHELNELGIDPYYFTLHVTVDNASNGHARRAIDAVRQLMARARDPAAFWRRVTDGYRLNDLGAGTTSIIESFGLEGELLRVLADKAQVGQHLHSDYCKIGGRHVSAWLSEPDDMPHMLRAMEEGGWIKRGRDVQESRFWGLASGPRAQMFGVFNGYELQLLRDWIGHDPRSAAAPPRVASFRARQRTLDARPPARVARNAAPRGLIRQHTAAANDSAGECNALRQFEQRLSSTSGKAEMMEILIQHLSPSLHHTPAGLMATRMLARLIEA